MGGGALSRRLARIHLYLRGRTKVCWQHGRHVSELFHSPLCAFIVWQGRPLFYSRRFQRRWEPPTCNLSCEAIFEGKKRHESGHSGHYGDAREFISIHARFEKLHSPFLLFFFHAERKRYDILFRLFPRFARERVFLWKKNPLAMHRLVSRIFLSRECRETTYLAIIRERILLELIRCWTLRDDFAIFF